MIGALELNYNPIENYNMIEDGTGGKTGNIKKERVYDRTKEMESIEVNAPITQVTVTADGLTSVSAAASVTATNKGQGVSSVGEEAGKKHGSTSINNNIPVLTGGADGASPTSETSVTTYDSNTYSPKDKTVNTGDKATNSTSAAVSSQEIIGNVKAFKGVPDADYSDTESYTNYQESSQLTRSGNIGVTTTQQMLEQELLLRSKPVIHNIISECIDQIMLHIWE
jgi:hypothetical protein